jgi:eukaryotic-like serine/threonine-protein kinase
MADRDERFWPEVERVYQAAVDLPDAARAAFLAEACAGDDILRREVEILLDVARDAEDFLERPALAEVAAGLAEARGGFVGHRLGGYEIAALLGAGGMGEVYRARDVRLGREVAIKVLDPSIASDPAYRLRFEEEARAASALNHPNIVTIYGVGEEEGAAFIAMELVDGGTLRDRMSAGVMPVPESIDLAAQLASALAAAHDQGVVHRDLKPENVMVTAAGHAKILDFGIARRLGRRAATADVLTGADAVGRDATAVTETGTIVGTVGYMSPEQAAGRPATAASDQFSFGAILYELLSGRRAFQRGSKVETLADIMHAEPEPLDRLNPAVPPALRRVLDRCLAKRPEDRFARTRDLEVVLRRLADCETARGVMRLTRRRLLWLGGATAAAAAAGLATWRLWPPPTLAVLPFANVSGSDEVDYLSIGITENLIWRLRHLPLAVRPFSLVSNFVGASIDPRAVGRQLGVGQILTGAIDLRGGRLLVSAELLDVGSGASLWKTTFDRAAIDIFAMWDQVATAVVDDGLHLRLTWDERLQLISRPTNSAEAYDLFLRARPFQMSGSEADYLAARDLLQRAVARDSKFAEAWVALAGTYWTAALDNFTRPSEAWPEVERSLTKAAAVNPQLPDLRFGRAIKAFFADWAWSAAEREWSAASGLPERDIQPELLLTCALGRWAMGDAAGALAIVRQARHIDPLSPIFILTEASYLYHLELWDEAARLYAAVTTTHPDAAAAYFGLAEVRRAQGRFDEAVAARVRGHELEGDDADEMMGEVMATARGEDGYRRLERSALTCLELPRLERRLDSGGYVSPLDFARAHARLGNRDQALRHLAQALADRVPALVFLNVDRAWDGVRDDSAFQVLLARVGLPAPAARPAYGSVRNTLEHLWRQV